VTAIWIVDGSVVVTDTERTQGSWAMRARMASASTPEAHAELEIGHRDALVRGVDQARGGLGVQIARREEAVRDGAERLAQPGSPRLRRQA